MSPLVPDLVLLLEANQQKVPKLLSELADEQKRLIEFGKWENEVNAAIQEGKSVEEIAKEVQKKDQEQPQEIPEVTAKTAEETTKSDQKQESKPKLKPKPKPAVNADGEVIHADSNWKSFLVKNGKTMKPPKIVKKTPAPKPEKTEAFFDFEKEKTTKKVPLVKRQKK